MHNSSLFKGVVCLLPGVNFNIFFNRLKPTLVSVARDADRYDELVRVQRNRIKYGIWSEGHPSENLVHRGAVIAELRARAAAAEPVQAEASELARPPFRSRFEDLWRRGLSSRGRRARPATAPAPGPPPIDQALDKALAGLLE